MIDNAFLDAARTSGSSVEQAGAAFMLHPETFAESAAAGYTNPFAGYVVGRGGVLGDATGGTVASVFAVFEPSFIKAMWDEGLKVRGALAAAGTYWDQAAGFGRRHLADVSGIDVVAELGAKIIAATSGAGLPLFAGWATMPLAEDTPARAMQVIFVLRELRGSVHFNALTISGVTPVEAHVLNKGAQYAKTFGWSEPFPDGADKKQLLADVEQTTNRRISEILSAALTAAEAAEFARAAAEVNAALSAQ
ncbi:hypothetical protein MINS_06200 [Mycolicibacterium insubricum]|uniref:EvbL n=1 Tax=Mycolicibacterium insubricum TaxID=444597 RepID=A0A1X0CZZ8_9MYCO|nr:evbL [Mycolicibacterium sp.]MCV7080527.1 evbL [Mycolicibacterium insubricum]ORA65727.1 evbL [Mycolicibacterium insubricum]BBZ65191.1 hypothetical protein MINS_06200 [Mycolicibacterium insubricum]